MFSLIQTALKGPAQARAQHRQLLRRYSGISGGLAALGNMAPPPRDDATSPIFLLSAGWRSGSTLLQRLVMSDKRVLIWGEPYDECGPIQAMAQTVKAFRPDWPPMEYFYDGTPPNQLSSEWIANLFPSLMDWRLGQRALFDTMFAQPARAAGAKRWGIKEVRLGADHCAYLRWLYPNAKFLLLYRNPLEAYRSYCRYGRSWYYTFPDRPVFTATLFGTYWRELMKGFLKYATQLNAQLVRYEDIVSGKLQLTEIDQYLDIQMDYGVLQSKIGSSERGGKKLQLNRLERWLLKRAVTPVSQELGYEW